MLVDAQIDQRFPKEVNPNSRHVQYFLQAPRMVLLLNVQSQALLVFYLSALLLLRFLALSAYLLLPLETKLRKPIGFKSLSCLIYSICHHLTQFEPLVHW